MGIFQDYCGNFLDIFLGNILQKLGIFLNIWGILPKNWQFSKIIVEISSTYFLGGGVFPKNWEFPKIFGEYFLKIGNSPGLLWKFLPHVLGEYSPKIGNFPKYLGNISLKFGIFKNYCETSLNIFWEIFYINLGNFPNIFKKILDFI